MPCREETLAYYGCIVALWVRRICAMIVLHFAYTIEEKIILQDPISLTNDCQLASCELELMLPERIIDQRLLPGKKKLI